MTYSADKAKFLKEKFGKKEALAKVSDLVEAYNKVLKDYEDLKEKNNIVEYSLKTRSGFWREVLASLKNHS